eukprot:292796-Chlamydomonas_euryale.AAC.2
MRKAARTVRGGKEGSWTAWAAGVAIEGQSGLPDQRCQSSNRRAASAARVAGERQPGLPDKRRTSQPLIDHQTLACPSRPPCRHVADARACPPSPLSDSEDEAGALRGSSGAAPAPLPDAAKSGGGGAADSSGGAKATNSAANGKDGGRRGGSGGRHAAASGGMRLVRLSEQSIVDRLVAQSSVQPGLCTIYESMFSQNQVRGVHACSAGSSRARRPAVTPPSPPPTPSSCHRIVHCYLCINQSSKHDSLREH